MSDYDREAGLKIHSNAFERYDGIYIPQPDLQPALKIGDDWKEVVTGLKALPKMKEGGRDEAKYFIVRVMGRTVDVERGLELDFEKDPLLAPVRVKLKELRQATNEYLEIVRGW